MFMDAADSLFVVRFLLLANNVSIENACPEFSPWHRALRV